VLYVRKSHDVSPVNYFTISDLKFHLGSQAIAKSANPAPSASMRTLLVVRGRRTGIQPL
jgi:hypothetical protein